MKISVFADSEGYENYLAHRPIKVFVDGEEWRNVLALDTDEGWVEYHPKHDGKFILDESGDAEVEMAYGAITVVGNGLLIDPKSDPEPQEEDEEDA